MNKNKIYLAIIAIAIVFYFIGSYSKTNVDKLEDTIGQATTTSAKPTETKPTSTTKPSAPKPTTGTPYTPTPSVSTLPATVTLRIGEKRTIGTVTLNPWEVMEDSRCAVNVQCLTMGKVKVATTIKGLQGSFNKEFDIGDAVKVDTYKVSLTAVTPAPIAGVTPTPTEYRFTFEISKF